MKLFAQIRKVDEEKRMVYARAAQEVVDKADEILDYAKSKPHFEAWSKEQYEASGGKSYGNVRAMHGKVAAGILPEPISFNDGEKAYDVAMKITDANEWPKCLDGTYTGVSIGGNYVGQRVSEKAADGREVKRYVARPVEISLVDSPCIPTARFFDVVKADGKTEQVAFKARVAEASVHGTEEEVDAFLRAMEGLDMARVVSFVEVERMLLTIDDLEKREFSADERKQAAKEGQALPDGSFPIKNKGDLANADYWYRRAGRPRSLIKDAMADYLPAPVLHEKRIGRQSADFLFHLTPHRATIAAELDRFQNSELVRRCLDLPSLRALVDAWPEPPFGREPTPGLILVRM